jgi:hypothetical protein
MAKFVLPHRPALEDRIYEGPQYGQVLSVSYVCEAHPFTSLHKDPCIGAGLCDLRRTPLGRSSVETRPGLSDPSACRQ